MIIIIFSNNFHSWSLTCARCKWSILESTIWEILYLGFPLIITGVGAGYILSEKVLDIAGLSMDTWKTGWTECIDSGRQGVNDSVLGWAMIS